MTCTDIGRVEEKELRWTSCKKPDIHVTLKALRTMEFKSQRACIHFQAEWVVALVCEVGRVLYLAANCSGNQQLENSFGQTFHLERVFLN